ncbi:flavin-containing monooxygenase-like protein [Phyllosticta citribraziliensis]|uniref:Flavin-containing monooxygenase-like protein n=1 Tax=Phyllosticta citribraziliensis TaxID=989973 RepID=A0ABR1LED3_9PEZI
MKSVAIIGAGPSGLVAAKTLLHAFPNNAFRVTVLERNSRVGGMWAMDKGQPGGKADSHMPTNISRFNVCFSDLAWSSVFPDDDGDGELPVFPQLWRVGKYLQAYADRYIPPEVIRLNAAVKSTELVHSEGRDRWRIRWEQSQQLDGTPSGSSGSGGSSPSQESVGEVEEEFDYLIAATGFMHDPKEHNVAVPSDIPLAVKHSSTFRDLNDLVTENSNTGNSIVVIGGSMSGCEAAANAALQISNCQSSPSFAGKDFSDFKVYHIMPRQFYILPYYLPPPPQEGTGYDPAPTFAPSDMRMFNLSKRPPGPVSPNTGLDSQTSAANKHKWLQALLGGNQAELGSPAMTFSESDFDDSPYVGISDNYAEFVRSGLIVPVRGRARSVEVQEKAEGSKTYVMKVAGEKDIMIQDVAGVVHASGFSPNGSFSWLPKDVREKMECDEQCNRLPLLLNSRCALHNAVPSLGMISFYQGIFWGVMEMQAYLLGRKWADDQHPNPPDHASEAELAEMRALRAAIVKNTTNVPQFWQGDFVGLMEEFARNLAIDRNDTGFDARAGPVFPARYTPPGAAAAEAAKAIADHHRISHAVDHDARFVAWAAFRALQGRWRLTRTLDSKLAGFPSGTFSGTATFHPRYPTDPAFAAEYLYVEDVTLVLESGHTLAASRRYVYRYDPARDALSVWFVQPANNKAADYLFFEMVFEAPDENVSGKRTGWVAHGAHPCEDDFYTSRVEFRFRGVYLEGFGVRYDVKGPRKDYVSENWYRR